MFHREACAACPSVSGFDSSARWSIRPPCCFFSTNRPPPRAALLWCFNSDRKRCAGRPRRPVPSSIPICWIRSLSALKWFVRGCHGLLEPGPGPLSTRRPAGIWSLSHPMSFACIYIPNFEAHAALRGEPGLRPQQTAVSARRSPAAEESAHAALIDLGFSFSPRLEDVAADTIILDLAGLEHL